ncbi:hypothetical protein SAMN05421819_1203 [Bryocella elongata]|uniref:UDP-glucose 4-epimerase n=1 Tax=Bryocella elongata TaxID=863522 RepID=A0A1H5UU92_9BACT|nr:DUF779 domain-containing protein [Bryocella elongata]SEF78635.1 hypothetical protein SAMN05421819_1203 [Bryocella elongata]
MEGEPLRVIATAAALKLIAELRAEHGPVIFFQSGGCCEGSAPMCFPLDELHLSSSDVLLGDIGESPFYISTRYFEYWKHTQMIVDVVPGFGAGFSLEGPEGLTFITRSRVFTDAEIRELRETDRI